MFCAYDILTATAYKNTDFLELLVKLFVDFFFPLNDIIALLIDGIFERISLLNDIAEPKIRERMRVLDFICPSADLFQVCYVSKDVRPIHILLVFKLYLLYKSEAVELEVVVKGSEAVV